MDYDNILFDLDGVLLAGFETDREIYRQAAEAVLRDFGVQRDAIDSMEALVDPDKAAEFRSAIPMDNCDTEAAWGYRESVATRLENERISAGGRVPFEDVAVLDHLAKDACLGIVSNNRQGTVRHCIDHFGWGNWIDTFRARFPTLRDFDKKKPDPTYLEWVLERLPEGETVFVGDRRSDLTTAQRAGCASLWLCRDGDPPIGNSSAARCITDLNALVA